TMWSAFTFYRRVKSNSLCDFLWKNNANGDGHMDKIWVYFGEAIDLSTERGAVVLAVLMMLIATAACTFTTRLARKPNWVVGKLKRKVDDTVIHYVVRIKNLLIWLTAGMFYMGLVPGLRAVMGTIMAGAGISAIVVGFAAKSTLANLISGLAIAVYRPIRIGDKLSIEGEYSVVEDITLRHTIVRTWEYKRLIIPNSKLDEMTLINYSIVDPSMKCVVELGVSYDTDIDLARKLILETADKCPYRDKAGKEAPILRVRSHGDFSIGLRLYVWVCDIDDAWQARFWLLENIKKRFDREGIEIPFPYRTMVYKKDLPPPRRNSENHPAPDDRT
ncbi:MAG: mechanosensitive ion channel family protein, partial [Thermodesulfobacteriota bacterium]|nr:mechanosensitive ion channel family protein [Thermodesulfobacteriota bacterium]